eukprot:CAMPEP_0181316710 /NCGR_PEP_ID=MMETSP1101-20121128/16043_1 /TAXON_ID=46948 /ORGANISM="Rhodomonas abbreviata, Strain Caron Lab Isolate" /LENGTH=133 /DNA_ID=CAMNT_0023423981 /DNA_START=14 /DNA_END=412 /DNA_ORIENTATION=+
MADEVIDDAKKMKIKLAEEKATLQKTLMAAAAAKPQTTGKIVNAYGQEEVGVPKWQQKQAALRDMYASNSSSADVSHEQRIMQQLAAKKAAKQQNPEQQRMQASAAAHSLEVEGGERAAKRGREEEGGGSSSS